LKTAKPRGDLPRTGQHAEGTSAAEELRDHLALASGVHLPIVDKQPADSTTPLVLLGPPETAEAR